jgi:MFS family permease
MDASTQQVPRAGRHRWLIVALLFAATTINYIDRTMLGLLVPTLQTELGWSEDDYGTVVSAFQAAYAFGFLIMGWLIDRFGPKIGYAIAITVWTVGHVAHGFASSLTSFIMARVVLGVGEAGHFPSVIRALSEWFPQKERAYAVGWVNSATTIGVILTAPTIALLMVGFGLDWRETFIYTGLFGVVLLVLWLRFYSAPRESGKVSEAELAWIEHDPPEKIDRVGWGELVTRREAWAFAVAKFLTDPVWFLMLFWLPKYFSSTYDVDLKVVLLPMIIMYLLSDVGSIVGLLEADPARPQREFRAQGDHAGRGLLRAAAAGGDGPRKHVAGGAPDRHCTGRAPGLFLHHPVDPRRPVPQAGGRLGDRPRRLRGRDWRHDHGQVHRPRAGCHRGQLHADLRGLHRGLFPRRAGGPRAQPAPRPHGGKGALIGADSQPIRRHRPVVVNAP